MKIGNAKEVKKVAEGKYGKQLNVQIPPELDKVLEWFCTNNNKKKKEVVSIALQQYLNKN